MEGKIALVTGGAGGIGSAICRLFASEGAKVAVADVNVGGGQKVVEEVAEAGGEALFIELDVTSEKDWERAVSTVVERYGGLNVLVNNAGAYSPELVADTPLETWERVMAVNATGTFLGSKHAIPEMLKAGGGSIVNMSSGAGMVGNADGTAYGPAKGAVKILTKTTAHQYALEGIRANSIHPGPIDTPMLHAQTREASERGDQVDNIPMGRIGTPEEIAYGALYLASDESSYVTGIELPIDGGRVNV